jgi:DedD protein
MTFMYDTKEEMETRSRRGKASDRAEKSGAEITLGTRSLLGIFFGLVLICGIFFGLGYSVGRVGTSHDAAASPADTPGLSADSHLQKPAAGQETLPPATTTSPDGGNTGPSEDTATNPSAQNGTNPPVTAVVEENAGTAPTKTGTAPAQTPPATLTPAAVTQPVATPGSPAPGTFMVQVAAVRVQQDADILVSALKKRGFNAVVRNEPQDALLHVQLGPFTSRADAMTTRSRLLAEGYNAVVK